MVKFDKRLDFLQALVIAVKQINSSDLNEELDWVEYYDIPYIKELVNGINIKKYLEIVDFINDIADCGYYTNLFLYFDDNFNLNEELWFKPFNQKDVLKFAELIKKIYENEKIEEIFIKYENYLNNLAKKFKNNLNIDFKEKLNEMYDLYDQIHFSINISLLINGGFSAHRENNISYIKGIKVKTNLEDIIFSEYIIICLFHEFSHFFVNKIIDKYFDNIYNLDILYSEAVDNGLPKVYQNKKTLLYEYFVRANSQILSEDLISKKEYDETIEWYKEIGFVRIEEIISIIKNGLETGKKFEVIFNTLCIEYLNNLHK